MRTDKFPLSGNPDFAKIFALFCELRSMRQSQMDAEVLRLVKYSVLSGKYYLLTNVDGAPAGYVAWADVDEFALSRLVRVGYFPKFYYEWGEGRIRLFTDMLLPAGRVNKWIRPILRKVTDDVSHVAFVRKGEVRVYIRRARRFVKIAANFGHG